jgi:hypothetical protein
MQLELNSRKLLDIKSLCLNRSVLTCYTHRGIKVLMFLTNTTGGAQKYDWLFSSAHFSNYQSVRNDYIKTIGNRSIALMLYLDHCEII